MHKLAKTSKSLFPKLSTHQFRCPEQYQSISQSYPLEPKYNEISKILNSWTSIFLLWILGLTLSKIPSKNKQKERGWLQLPLLKFNYGDQEVPPSAICPNNSVILQFNILRKDLKHFHKLKMDLVTELLMTLSRISRISTNVQLRQKKM